jgi:transposase
LRSKIPELEAALAGRIREHHRFMWREVLYHLDELNERLATLDAQIRQLTAPYEGIIERLDAIPGIDRRTAEVILAEIGPDVTPFPTAQHLASWACLCPGNNISGNKRRSGKTRHGQNWLRTALVEAAWAASHTKNTYLSSQFHRLRARRGDKRAAVAVAHSILIVVYHLLAKPEAVFQDLGGDYFLKRNAEQEERRAVRKLTSLGFAVTLTPIPAAASVPS